MKTPAKLHDYLKDTFGTGLTDSGVENVNLQKPSDGIQEVQDDSSVQEEE